MRKWLCFGLLCESVFASDLSQRGSVVHLESEGIGDNGSVVKVDGFGCTDLMYAASSNCIQMVHALAESQHGLQDHCGWSALMWASYCGNADAVEILLEYEKGMQITEVKSAQVSIIEDTEGEEASVEDNAIEGEITAGGARASGWTRFIHEDEHNKKRTECFATPVDSDYAPGWTALMIAVERNNLKCVRLLAKYERDITLSDGRTALDLAKAYGRTKIIEFLTKYDQD